METITTKTNWIALTHEMGKTFEKSADRHDDSGKFVFENYEALKANKFFSVAIPAALGGGGVTHTTLCEIIRIIGQYCGSTALAFSMHQHLIAAAVWKYRHKGLGESMLRNVAENELVLISTGARDWLGSNGEMEKVAGGYLFSGKKHFASQSSGGDIAVTSAPYLDENGNWNVLHFAVPMDCDGVALMNDWNVMGMRATGSETIAFNKVFIPESAISLSRPRDAFHPVWNVVLTVALPLIMSAYVGIAEKAFELAKSIGKSYKRNIKHMPYMMGKLHNNLISAQTQLDAMISYANDLNFQPDKGNTVKTLSLKTNISKATKQVVENAMEAIGGQSYLKSRQLERLFRDIQASEFHPLPTWEQYAFTGNFLLNQER